MPSVSLAVVLGINRRRRAADAALSRSDSSGVVASLRLRQLWAAAAASAELIVRDARAGDALLDCAIFSSLTIASAPVGVSCLIVSVVGGGGCSCSFTSQYGITQWLL